MRGPVGAGSSMNAAVTEKFVMTTGSALTASVSNEVSPLPPTLVCVFVNLLTRKLPWDTFSARIANPVNGGWGYVYDDETLGHVFVLVPCGDDCEEDDAETRAAKSVVREEWLGTTTTNTAAKQEIRGTPARIHQLFVHRRAR